VEGYRRIGAIGDDPLAVSSANAMGCNTLLAHVQEQNGPLFRDDWRRLRNSIYGQPHLKMQRPVRLPPCATQSCHVSHMTWTPRR
jgi:hypothetical protein